MTQLEAGIRRWISEWNACPKPFIWAKTADEILESAASYRPANYHLMTLVIFSPVREEAVQERASDKGAGRVAHRDPGVIRGVGLLQAAIIGTALIIRVACPVHGHSGDKLTFRQRATGRRIIGLATAITDEFRRHARREPPVLVHLVGIPVPALRRILHDFPHHRMNPTRQSPV